MKILEKYIRRQPVIQRGETVMQEERKKMEPETIFNIVRVSLIVVVIIACVIFIK